MMHPNCRCVIVELPETVIVKIPHPRYTRTMQWLADRAVRMLPEPRRSLVYWRLLDLVRAAPQFEVLSSERER